MEGKNITNCKEQKNKTFVPLGMTKYMAQASKATKKEQKEQRWNKKKGVLFHCKRLIINDLY